MNIADDFVFQHAHKLIVRLRFQFGFVLACRIKSAREQGQAQLDSSRRIIVRQMTVMDGGITDHAYGGNRWQPRIALGLCEPRRGVVFIAQAQ